jgi:hypothetical protein
MSTPSHGHPASPESLIEPTDCHTAHFATRWLQPSMAVITAHGELDAANAQEFVDYALRHAPHTDRLVLDLTGVGFFGTAGFSALHTVNCPVRRGEDRMGAGAQPGRQPAAANLRSGFGLADLRECRRGACGRAGRAAPATATGP